MQHNELLVGLPEIAKVETNKDSSSEQNAWNIGSKDVHE